MTSPDDRARRDAELARAHLERFERDGDADGPAEAVRLLDAALAAGPDADEATEWRFLLGLALGYRAAVTGQERDWTRAIEQTSAVLDQVWPDPSAVAEVGEVLGELHLRRHLALVDADAATAATAEEFLRDITALCSRLADSPVLGFLSMLRGVALLHRHAADGDEADLTEGTRVLEEVLPDLPPEWPYLAGAWRDLIDAYLATWGRSEEATWLDRAVTAAGRAVAAVADDEEARAELLRLEGECLEIRWYQADDPADRDRAIDRLRRVSAEVLAGGGQLEDAARYDVLLSCGTLLAMRGDADGSGSDLAESIRLLAAAAERIPDGQPDRWICHWALATARMRHGQLTGSVESREVARGFAAALAAGIPAVDDESDAHVNRINAAHQWLSNADGDPSAVAELRAAVTQADAAVDRIRAADPAAGALLAGMAAIAWAVVTGHDLGYLDQGRLGHLLTVAGQWPDAPPGWDGVLAVGEGNAALLAETLGGRKPDTGDAVGRFADAVGAPGLDEGLRRDLLEALALAASFVGTRTGDRGLAESALKIIGRAGGQSGGHIPSARGILRLVTELGLRWQAQDIDGLAAEVDRAAELLPQLAPGPHRDALGAMLNMFRYARGGGAVFPVGGAPDSAGPVAPDGSLGGLYHTLGGIAGAAGQMAAAATTGDTPAVRERLNQVEDMASRLNRDSSLWEFATGALAAGWLYLARQYPADRQAASAAARWHEEAVRALGGPHNPMWAILMLSAGEAARLIGDLAGGRDRGRSALRGHAWQVLLQAGTERAVDAARRAAADALTVAGWCAADGAHDDLVRALDAGRGLVLHAATSARGIAADLRALGHGALAAEWERHAQTATISLPDTLPGLPGLDGVALPSDLRPRVLRALTEGGAGRLLDPPDPGEIRGALAGCSADALVYLVPEGDRRSGMAVMVPADGEVKVLPLPGLSVGPGSQVARYAEAYERYRTAPEELRSAPLRQWRLALGDLSRWAWQVAGEGLLSWAAGRWPGRPPRLVLVPMGPLALVPWHAASRWTGGTRRYLAQDAVVSTAASARLLGEVVARPALGPGPALIVGNPTGDLPSAGDEACAIHEVFYRGGNYYGIRRDPDRSLWSVSADGAGTPEKVLGWLTGSKTPRSMLHLACHCVAEPSRPAKSRFMLARDRTRVRAGTADDLAAGVLPVLSLLDRAPTTRMLLDRVFLAACSTHVSGADYDEAFSPASVFLAAGARTVFGSLWAVPDDGTSLLMFMTHHFLNTSDCRPAEALHLAQRWMLDPDREPPRAMPSRLVETLRSTDAADPVSWAGFVHLGA
ncbi:MAG TPA: CHAT domain-containing protein [Mycobacteriales bacterium]|nr:CHAT domain-containing protein [Mycobacteriales bacterium]